MVGSYVIQSISSLYGSLFQLSIAAAVICASRAAPQSSAAAAASTAGGAPELVREYNNVNEDGTYSFGFEYSDGTFKTESKDAEGNVKGSSDNAVLFALAAAPLVEQLIHAS